MTIDLENFWQSNHYKHPPLTDDMINLAQEKLGVTLPVEYVALLRRQNGGYIQGFVYPMMERTTWAEDHVGLDELFGIVTDPSQHTAQNILDTEYMTEEWGLPPRQVLLSGDGHWWITLDYRNGANPSVAWIDVECDEDIQIAPSFPDFLSGLVPASEFNDTSIA